MTQTQECCLFLRLEHNKDLAEDNIDQNLGCLVIWILMCLLIFNCFI